MRCPRQIAQWDKQGDWSGYCAFFKNELFHLNEKVDFLQQYPFFAINETNLIPLDETEFKSLKLIFEKILIEQEKLVNVHFREKIAVEDYADLLNISPNHLSQTIKKTIGKTTKSIINQRRLNEAKYLSRYTYS